MSPKAISPRRPWVIALVTIVAVATLFAAIAIVTYCVVVVQTVEMTESLAAQTVLNLAVAGSLAQISLLSFMVVREKYRHRKTTRSAD